MGMNFAVLVGPDVNQLVLRDQAHHFSSRLGWKFLEPLFGSGLLLQDGRQHQDARKLIYPALHGQVITEYFNTIQRTVERFLVQWDKHPVALVDEFRHLTLTIACQLFLGCQDKEELKELSQWFLEFVEGLRTFARFDIPITKYGRARIARRKLEQFMLSQIAKRRQEGNGGIRDILGLLLTSTDEEGNTLGDSAIVSQTLQLLFGGHETMAKLLGWCLFELAGHPDWTDRLRQEQSKVVGSGNLTSVHLKHLVQMSCVLKEVERLYPPSYFIPRGVVKDLEVAGYFIPAGWFVMLSPLLTHRMVELYDNPNDFDPERFAPPREEDKKHAFGLIGFGGGQHQCIGYELAQMEAKIILAVILRHFEWKITPEHSVISPVFQSSKFDRALVAQFRRID